MNLQETLADTYRELALAGKLSTVRKTLLGLFFWQALCWASLWISLPGLSEILNCTYAGYAVWIVTFILFSFVEKTTTLDEWNFTQSPLRNLLAKTLGGITLAVGIAGVEFTWYAFHGARPIQPFQFWGTLLNIACTVPPILWCMLFLGKMRTAMMFPAVACVIFWFLFLVPHETDEFPVQILYTSVLIGMAALSFCFGLTMRSDPRRNRAAPARWTELILLLLMWLPLLISCKSPGQAVDAWGAWALFCSCGVMVAAAGERLDPTQEMADNAPTGYARRIGSLFFASGAATGLLMGKAQLLAGAAILLIHHMDWQKVLTYQAWHEANQQISPLLIIPLYLFFYCCLSVSLRRYLGLSRLKAAVVVLAICNLPALATIWGWKYAALPSILVQHFIAPHRAMLPAAVLAVLGYILIIPEWVRYIRIYFKRKKQPDHGIAG